MCIDVSTVRGEHHKFLEYGETYIASGEQNDSGGRPCYVIPELPNSYNSDTGTDNYKPLYAKRRFIPLSNIDETELIKERQSEIVTQ
jgi:hypothetical protein